MVVKDFYCCTCSTVVCDISVESRISELVFHCAKCKTNRKHVSICAGGVKKRYRYNDWGGVDFSECVRLSKPESVTETFEIDQKTGRTYNAQVVHDRHVSGVLCEDRPRFSRDSLDDRHDRVKHRSKVRKGKVPMFFDQKGRLP